ncbi:MAG: NAD(+) synthase [Leptospiraceae bacterium]|nr:NAD(+) synthase [Leptospiraceae bacterium]
MNRIQISTICINTTPLDFKGNLERILNVLKDNASNKASILVFPELAISGYGCEDMFYSPFVWRESLKSLNQILHFTKDKLVVVGLPIFLSPFLYNCIAVILDTKLIGFVTKTNLANTGVHYEKRWFKEGGFPLTFSPNIFGKELFSSDFYFGNFILETKNLRVGFEICEDSWVIERQASKATLLGSEVILSSGASHFAFGKQEIRKRIFTESSRAHNSVFVYSNLCGNESGRIIFEGGGLITANGEILAEGERLFLSDSNVTSAIVDIDQVHASRAKNFRNNNKKTERLGIVSSEFNFQDKTLSISSKRIQSSNQYNDFTKAVTLGLFDYLRKSKSKGFTLSLSGGADSAACAILVWIMLNRIKTELDKNYLESIGINEKELLVTIYQGTENNSEETKNFAKELSKLLDVIHYEIDIDEPINWITEKISSITNKNLNWKEHDLALQNIQARARSPIVWLLANLYNHLLISTGNRSESSVGYTTMDGDSSGSLCPISGVSKEFLLEWLEFLTLNNSYSIDFGILKSLLNRRPTAELKPLSESQFDEKDLMPYPILQKIEEQLIINGRSREEALEILQNSITEISIEDWKKYIDKFYSMFPRSQWKRERLPPGFHLDEYGLDPKSSYRFPILSGF